MERSMPVVEALNPAASTYSQLLDQLIMAQQQNASRVSDVSTATPLDGDVDDELVELGSASSEGELPN
ncbi:hypothetical protein Hamer_G010115 [Homarus americanus]|uniref:Uncharacterized protein n=1 Tax=Homarus americanus TaxID=6706 RepID=A0A8J5K5A1_HOMAM|nr:hypothetical protein Hamer_G010115 [Homarus americanus]